MEVICFEMEFLIVLVGSLWSPGWENDPASVLPIGMPLNPIIITRATVVILSELEFAVSVLSSSSDSFFGAFVLAYNKTSQGRYVDVYALRSGGKKQAYK